MILPRHAISALLAGAAFSAVLAGALLTGLAPTATSFHSTAVSTPVCEASTERTTVSGDWTPVLTHVSTFQAVPGTDRQITRTVPVVRRLRSAVTGTDADSLSARQILEKAETTFGTASVPAGRHTSGSPEAITFSVGGSTSPKYYAMYHGRRFWTGTWETSRCAADGKSATPVQQGKWRSFSADIEGAALCPAPRHDRTTLPYRACRAIGR